MTDGQWYLPTNQEQPRSGSLQECACLYAANALNSQQVPCSFTVALLGLPHTQHRRPLVGHLSCECAGTAALSTHVCWSSLHCTVLEQFAARVHAGMPATLQATSSMPFRTVLVGVPHAAVNVSCARASQGCSVAMPAGITLWADVQEPPVLLAIRCLRTRFSCSSVWQVQVFPAVFLKATIAMSRKCACSVAGRVPPRRGAGCAVTTCRPCVVWASCCKGVCFVCRVCVLCKWAVSQEPWAVC
jgi:hypothetical protein